MALRVVSCFLMLVTLSACRSPKRWVFTPPPPPVSTLTDKEDFTTLWDKDHLDPNGMPRNPVWGSQKRESKLPPVKCAGDPYQKSCTEQSPILDNPGFPTGPLCWAANGFKPFYGHADWMISEYEGSIGWLNFAADFDYNFIIHPRDNAGVTVNNFPQNSPNYLEMEFDSRETVDNFAASPWWKKLTELAASRDFAGIRQHLHPNKETLPCGVAIGLFGLDCDHGCRSELHPVYAMALQVNEDATENIWAIMVRNWGNGGFCSQYDNYLDEGRISLLLPSTSSAPPRSIQVSEFAGTTGVACPTFSFLPGQGERIDFNLPRPEAREMAVMLLRVEWPDGAPMQCTQVGFAELERLASREEAKPETEMGAEDRLGFLLRKIGRAQSNKVPAFETDVMQPYLSRHAPALQTRELFRTPVSTPRQCAALAAVPQISGTTPPHKPTGRLRPDKIKNIRDRAMLWNLCHEYASKEEKLPKEFEDVCHDKRLTKIKRP